eukprot:jgi/Tetstr1/423773/TSEL_014400.t1
MAAKRLLVVLSVVCFFVLGIPVWYNTTSVNRPTLPYDEMLNYTVDNSTLPTTVRVWLCTENAPGSMESTRPGGPVDAITAFLDRHSIDVFSAKGPQMALTWVTPNGCESADPLKLLRGRRVSMPHASLDACPSVLRWVQGLSSNTSSAAMEDGLAHLLAEEGIDSKPGFYDIFLIEGTSLLNLDATKGLILGRSRISWLAGDMWEQRSSSARSFSSLMAHAVAMSSASFGEVAAASETALLRNGHAKIILSLCNGDPPSGSCSWDGHGLAAMLQPAVDMLLPLGTMNVESQILQYTRARVRGDWSAKESSYVISSDELPFFVDLEWNLEPDRAVLSGQEGEETAQTQHENNVMHWIVYVPPPDQRPLQIKDVSSGSLLAVPAFTMESWGGVVLYSPEKGCCMRGPGGTHKGEADGTTCDSRGRSLEPEESLALLAVMVTQLRHGLGLQDKPSTDILGNLSVETVHEENPGFASWEIDTLLRGQFMRNMQVTASTLSSLAEVISNLPNLDIPKEVSGLVDDALRGLQSAREAAEDGLYHKAAAEARAAKAAADAAFFHPSIMAERSYPLQHLVAMYMPYFLPISVPVLVGIKSELLHRAKRDKDQSKKQC